MIGTPVVLLVHGSWHGPWCWELLLPELEKRGIHSETVSLPSCGDKAEVLKGIPEDAEAIAEAANKLRGDVYVLAHSYGGAAVSEASFGGKVRRLIFLGAFMPDTGRQYVADLPPGPLPTYVELRDDGTMAVPSGQARSAFYADCTPEIAAWAESKLRLQSQAVLGHQISRAAWRDVPSSYIVLTEDRALPVEMQHRLAARADEQLELQSSHSPMLSKPKELAQMVADLVARVRAMSSLAS
jgi:pimeloyl-ACP methyl ester carboxylesterase